MDRMKELVELLNNAAREYYQQDRQIISDFEYDRLYDELVRIEDELGVRLSSSPTQKVGYTALSSLKKVRHASKILSLDKTKEVSRLEEWLGEREALLSWKLDGLTIVLTYENGELIQAVTRGNGEIGEDITHNARVFKNVPVSLAFKGRLSLRGEGIITYSEFERINSELDEGEEGYKNPRNLCSGTVRQLNSEIAAKRKVMLYAFTLVDAEGAEFTKKSDCLDWLEGLGFTVVEHRLVTAESIRGVVEYFQGKIATNDFASDGLVLTYNDIEYSRSLGETSKFPKDSIAFKWADETAETVVQEIEWNTSRTGLINPVAIFEPVELEGTVVNRASVHNVSVLEELALGVGDRISVYKANMIIPQVAENFTRSASAEIPESCPVCGGETEIRSVREGRALYCTNPNCAAQRLRALAHFVSRDAMNIDGLSIETLKKLVDIGFVETYPDIFELEKYGDKIKSMEGFGEKSFLKLISSIEKAKKVQLANFINALGINHVGLSNAKILCRNYPTIDAVRAASQEELVNIDGFGEIIAHSLCNYFNNSENIALLERACKYISFEETENLDAGGDALSGLTFVITGEISRFKNRKELQQRIEAMGGRVTGSVTKKTSFLINNDNSSSSAKNTKANELGIPIITEEEFINKYLSGVELE